MPRLSSKAAESEELKSNDEIRRKQKRFTISALDAVKSFFYRNFIFLTSPALV